MVRGHELIILCRFTQPRISSAYFKLPGGLGPLDEK